ncbi:MAG TPA: MotA/TolQ/ExbB proton channel family protein [Polyangiaceae bacterium]|nr:MotA/TolQ/ExbB proton channel family protein [Polyangiaceae bacterium]
MDFSIYHMWQQMGMTAKGVVVILLIMSVYSIGVSVDRWVALRKGRNQSVGYVGALQQIVGANSRLEEVVGLDQRWKGSPVANVIGNGVKEFLRGVKWLGPKAADPIELEMMVDGVGRSMNRVKARELANMKRGLSVLATISSSAPFVGLFGTVFGIITAFQSMGDPSKGGGGGLATVSTGISEALLTTAVGLAVAIVSVWFYNYFIDRVDEITIDVDETAGEMLETMLREGRSRLPGDGKVSEAST